jgi:hypothetical protein
MHDKDDPEVAVVVHILATPPTLPIIPEAEGGDVVEDEVEEAALEAGQTPEQDQLAETMPWIA